MWCVVSLCSGWWLTQKLTTGQSSENKGLGCSATNGTLLSQHSPKAQGPLWKKAGKTVRVRGQGGPEQNSVGCTLQDHCTHELTAGDSLGRIKPAKILPQRAKELMSPLPLTEELWTTDGSWGKKSQFSLRMWLLVGRQYSIGRPHTQKCTSVN